MAEMKEAMVSINKIEKKIDRVYEYLLTGRRGGKLTDAD
jgi:hypothetical protein